jgi:hypothetical protein
MSGFPLDDLFTGLMRWQFELTIITISGSLISLLSSPIYLLGSPINLFGSIHGYLSLCLSLLTIYLLHLFLLRALLLLFFFVDLKV